MGFEKGRLGRKQWCHRYQKILHEETAALLSVIKTFKVTLTAEGKGWEQVRQVPRIGKTQNKHGKSLSSIKEGLNTKIATPSLGFFFIRKNMEKANLP